MTAAEMTASFRKQTRKRKGDAFQEDGVWCVVDADGHVWEHHDDEWTRFTDDDDEHVREIAREKRARPTDDAWRLTRRAKRS